ncbi:BLUF domain-containing protein [Gilvibacter sediminis]|uniref:BLUF domain-containing protein n=1 Tax=Gilvibacter sediminis TaxID=379071 RepID=UPI0023508680|nr:BLUF domain-containing protein [Gilvibacter sediminis]MDC7998633.1 BLUF domain-containing protein [Gilvibacter sediminis]
MKTQLHTICYVSTAVSTITQNNVHDVFEGIVDNNLSLGITGVLLYSHGNFMQILEGPSDALKPLYDSIKRDPRHHHIIEIMNQPAEERMFENYLTGFTIVDSQKDIYQLQKYMRFLEDNFDDGIKNRAEMVRPFIY